MKEVTNQERADWIAVAADKLAAAIEHNETDEVSFFLQYIKDMVEIIEFNRAQ